MHFSSIALIATSLSPALAVTFSGFTTTKCSGGPYIKCNNIAQQVCCNVVVGNPSTQHGASSALYANLPKNSRIFGSQNTRDGNSCGAVVGNHATPGGGSVCTTIDPGIGQYAGLSWQANSSKRKRGIVDAADGAHESANCTSSVAADTLVMADRTQYDLTKMSDAEKLQLWDAAHSGAANAFVAIPANLAKYAMAEKADPLPTDFTVV